MFLTKISYYSNDSSKQCKTFLFSFYFYSDSNIYNYEQHLKFLFIKFTFAIAQKIKKQFYHRVSNKNKYELIQFYIKKIYIQRIECIFC